MKSMNPIHGKTWAQLDLNLLRVFVTIWEQRHLGRAAAVLHRTPSAVSHALRRLRVHTDDALFVRDGRVLRPTPRAERMAPAILDHLAQLRSLILPAADFSPQLSTRQFVIGVREALEPLLTPGLMAQMRRSAPQVSLHSVRLDRRDLAAALQQGRMDVAIDVEQEGWRDILRHPLLREPLCVVMRAGHALSRGFDLAAYLAADHVLVSGRPTGPAIEDLALATLGAPPRRIALRCQNYQAGAHYVAGSDALLTLPRRLARGVSDPLGNHARSLPFALPPLSLHLYWHAQRSADPAHVWLREQILAVAHA